MTNFQSISFWRTSAKLVCLLGMVTSFGSLTFVGCGTGGIGDPCVPEDEYRENFAGFKLSEENIESRSFQCETRICLVNHFQGRVSCPKGQKLPINCSEGGQASCDESDPGTTCQEAGVILTDCDPTGCDEEGADQSNCNGHPDCGGGDCNRACGGNVCDEKGRYCHAASGQCPAGYQFSDETELCTAFICAPEEADRDTRCYVPGTESPVAVPVCSQCGKRQAENAVYCSCRCAAPEDNKSDADDNFNFCDCPDGYTCTEIRPNVGLGDAQITGSYCVKEGTAYTQGDEGACGTVLGFWGPGCDGLAPSGGS